MVSEEDYTHSLNTIKKLKEAYSAMKNVAAGLTNFCEESVSVRRLEREYDEAEKKYIEACM